MRWSILALILLAGCADPAHDIDITGDATGEQRATDEYWLVYIEGNETRDPPTGMSCSVMWSYSIDEDAQQIRYADDEHAQNVVRGDPIDLIAASVWDASHCPVAYKITDEGRITIPTNGLGDVEVRIDDGVVQVRDQTLQPGQEATLSGSATQEGFEGLATYHTELRIRALGAWPLAGLEPGQP